MTQMPPTVKRPSSWMNECNPRATFKPTNYKWQLELERPQPTLKQLNDYKLTTLSQSQCTSFGLILRLFITEPIMTIDNWPLVKRAIFYLLYMLFQQIWKPANMTKRLYRWPLDSDDFTDD